MRASLEIRVHAYSLTPKTNNTRGRTLPTVIVVRKKARAKSRASEREKKGEGESSLARKRGSLSSAESCGT